MSVCMRFVEMRRQTHVINASFEVDIYLLHVYNKFGNSQNVFNESISLYCGMRRTEHLFLLLLCLIKNIVLLDCIRRWNFIKSDEIFLDGGNVSTFHVSENFLSCPVPLCDELVFKWSKSTTIDGVIGSNYASSRENYKASARDDDAVMRNRGVAIVWMCLSTAEVDEMLDVAVRHFLVICADDANR